MEFVARTRNLYFVFTDLFSEINCNSVRSVKLHSMSKIWFLKAPNIVQFSCTLQYVFISTRKHCQCLSFFLSLYYANDFRSIRLVGFFFINRCFSSFYPSYDLNNFNMILLFVFIIYCFTTAPVKKEGLAPGNMFKTASEMSHWYSYHSFLYL